jgi:predicted nucleotidyltransferase component of viral defense system
MNRATQAKRVMDALKKLTKASTGNSINELRLIVALERAIARLESHPRLSSHLIFKGGFVLLKTVDTTRFTHDVDALALGISRPRVPDMVDRALKLDLDDGLWYGDFVVEDLADQGPYGGFRFSCAFQIGDPPKGSDKIKKLSRIHIDMGFGDPVEAIPGKQPMPSILPEGKPVSWSVYPLEYIFAEKLEALFVRGSANSRAKDVYDMPLIFPKCLSKQAILKAIERTFSHRKTPIPDSFAKAADTFDLSIMRSAWLSVELADDSRSFENAWNDFLVCLHALDSVRS